MDLRTRLLKTSRAEAQAWFVSQSRNAYLGRDIVLCQILGQCKFLVRGDYTGMAPHLIFDGFWEFWLTRYMAQIVKPGDHVLDIGANHGYFTVLAGLLNAPDGRITSFEPATDVHDCLTKSVSLNGLGGRSRVVNAGIANVEAATTQTFLRHDLEPHNGRFLQEGESVEAAAAVGEVHDFAVEPLRTEDFDRLDVVKIDVEGAELDVLDSGKALFDTYDPTIVCEVNLGRHYGYDDVMQRLGRGGQLLYLHEDAQIKVFDAETAEGSVGRDILVVRQRHGLQHYS